MPTSRLRTNLAALLRRRAVVTLGMSISGAALLLACRGDRAIAPGAPRLSADASSNQGDGLLYVPNDHGRSITVYAVNGAGRATVVKTIAGSNTRLHGTEGVAVGADGTIYATNVATSDTEPNQVTVYAPGATGNATPIAIIVGSNTQLWAPAGIAMDGAGNIYVANSGNSLITIYAPGANGNVAPTATIGGSNTGFLTVHDVALDNAGNIYVTSAVGPPGFTGKITVFAAGTTGNATPQATITGSHTGLRFPDGIVINSAGDIYVANAAADNVLAYAAGATGDVAPIAMIGGSNTGIVTPGGVALDVEGRVYVATNQNSIPIFREGTSGNVAPTATLTPSNAPGLDGPFHIKFLP